MASVKKSSKRNKFKTKNSTTATAASQPNAAAGIPCAGLPDPLLEPDAGEEFRAVLMDHLELCFEENCTQETRLAVQNGQGIPLPYCSGHAHVVWADWMVVV